MADLLQDCAFLALLALGCLIVIGLVIWQEIQIDL